MDKMILLCPGQGAQSVGMGKAWYEASAEARGVWARADAILAEEWAGEEATKGLGKLSEVCFEGPGDVLNRTDVSQPAIFVASVACLLGMKERLGIGDGGLPLAAAAGLSLGEYTALCVAGAIGFEDGLKLVALRGRAMQEAAEGTASGMVALIGADEEQAGAVCAAVLGSSSLRDASSIPPQSGSAPEPEGGGHPESKPAPEHTKVGLSEDRPGGAKYPVLVCANFNAPGQVVVSGSAGACTRAIEVAGEMGLRAKALPVAGAFHSPIMASAAARLGEALEATAIGEPGCVVMANVTGEPHGGGGGGSMAAAIRQRLVEQLTSPVRWSACCAWLIGNLPRDGGSEFVELSPGKTLGGLMRRIDRGTKVKSYDDPAIFD